MYSRSVAFKRTNNFVFFFFTYGLDRRIYQTKFPTLKIFILFVTVVMLSRYQPPVNCSSRNAEGNFTHKFASFPFRSFLYVKRFLNVPSKCTYLFLIHVSLCYTHHLQGESLITCTKPYSFYSVLCTLHWSCYTVQCSHFCRFTFSFTMIKTISSQWRSHHGTRHR